MRTAISDATAQRWGARLLHAATEKVRRQRRPLPSPGCCRALMTGTPRQPCPAPAPVGWELKGSSCTTSIMGSRSTRERTATLLPVPRSPMISTPPMVGSTTLSSSASFMSSCPASRVKGKAGRFLALSCAGAATADTSSRRPRCCCAGPGCRRATAAANLQGRVWQAGRAGASTAGVQAAARVCMVQGCVQEARQRDVLGS